MKIVLSKDPAGNFTLLYCGESRREAKAAMGAAPAGAVTVYAFTARPEKKRALDAAPAAPAPLPDPEPTPSPPPRRRRRPKAEDG